MLPGSVFNVVVQTQNVGLEERGPGVSSRYVHSEERQGGEAPWVGVLRATVRDRPRVA